MIYNYIGKVLNVYKYACVYIDYSQGIGGILSYFEDLCITSFQI